MWVVLIAGSTGSALRAVRPANLLIQRASREQAAQIALASLADAAKLVLATT
jgi:hypothetical protein